MTNCELHLAADGNYYCEDCDPNHLTGLRASDRRNCKGTSEPLYDEETAIWIIANLCGPCPRREQTRCKPDPDKPTKCGNRGRQIRDMLQLGICCPEGRW